MSIMLITFPTLQCCSANGPCRPDGQTPCPLTAHLTQEVCCFSADKQMGLPALNFKNLKFKNNWRIFSSTSVRKFFWKLLCHYIICSVYVSIYFLSIGSFINSPFKSFS